MTCSDIYAVICSKMIPYGSLSQAVAPMNVIRKVLCSNLGLDTDCLTVVLRDFPHSHQENAQISNIGHDFFLPHYFQFMIH
jgi:hypothetical protein